MVMLKIQNTVTKVSTNAALERQFEPEMDTWRGKPTGRLRLNPKTCGFCDYVHKCWPNADYLPHPDSTAKNPPSYWYLKE
jgi:hypothetical protein